mmetsp:Transcript_19384/g.57625  ORF Transcript_19384/g.57625 Transcript_19384/m.57625 type:complete len:259 (-) Transcript_19384:34-810(-)
MLRAFLLAALACTGCLGFQPLCSRSLRRARARTHANTNDAPFADGGWRFEGRFLFAPQLVRAPPPPPNTTVLALFGWTLGGVVALQYDTSPVGPYLEFVDMGALVFRNGCLGQWGRELLVSTAAAEDACKDIWRVPAAERELAYRGAGESLVAACEGDSIAIDGWGRVSGGIGIFGLRPPAVPVLWTPEMKALWAPIKFPSGSTVSLALHALGLSFTGLALRRFEDRRPSTEGRVGLGFCVAADGLRIDIAPHRGDLL